MTDYIHLSATTPSDEQCAQLGIEGYMKSARLEAHVYIRQLIRAFGKNPTGTRFTLSHCPHDFGTYIDIRFFYDDEDQQHVAYMSQVEGGCERWDDDALRELREKEYSLDDQDETDSECEGDSPDDPYEGYTYDNGPTGHGDICWSDADSGL